MPEIAEPAVRQRGDLVLVDGRFDQSARWSPGQRLDGLFEERCDSLTMGGCGGRLAVDAGDTALSYPRLDSLANQLARFLLARGARPGDRIGLLFDSGIHNCVALLAVLKIKAAYVPLDVGFPPDRVEFITRDAGVRMLLSVSSLADRVTGAAPLDVDLVLLDEVADQVEALDYHRLVGSEHGGPVDDLAYLIYTSGSTGRPKGVAVTHASICNFVRVAAEVYRITGRDRMYQGLTLAFDFAVEEIWVPWMVGATVVPKPPGGSLLGADLHEFLVGRGITAMCCVPTLLATLDSDLPELRFLLVSGEACPADLVNRWHRPHRRFLNVYGPTEATVSATWTEVHPARPVTIGVPLPTYSTVILDPDRDRALPPGESGELGIAGIGLARGYLNRADLTAKAFIPDFLGLPNNPSGRIYRTGDLARVSEDGEIEYLGRIDTQVKIRGYRIELTEIESVLLGAPGIAQAVVDTVEPEPGVRELVAYYTARADADPDRLDRGEIVSHLRLHLPAYMVPAYFEQLDALPMTPGDKVDRKALPPPRGARGTTPGLPHIAPSTEMERILAGALAELLRTDRVSVVDDFFADLGADSLVMAKFSAAARALPGLPPLSMKDIYLNPTIRRLAAALGEPGASRPLPPVTPSSAPVAGSSLGYALCGVAQLVAFAAAAALGGLVLVGGLGWVTADGAGVARIVGRTVGFELALLVGWTALSIMVKWLLVGAWQPSEIRLWSPGYLRFWLVKVLIRTSPMAVFTGSPLYVWYLRALGAKIGRGVTIHSTHVPVATDLLSIGDGSVIRRECYFNGYRAINGVLQIGPVTLGRNVHIGEKTVLDIHTTLGDGAELGHTSALQTGQSVPPGRTWHGCPAEPTEVSYRTVPTSGGGAVRRVVYSALHLSAVLLGGAVVMAALAVGSTPGALPLPLTGLIATGADDIADPSFYVSTILNSLELFLAGIVASTVVVMTVPRLLQRLLTPDRVYPLYGFHHVVAQAISRLSNVPFLVDLVGDSSAVVHYLRGLGYDLCRVKQCGSNFGATIRQDSPRLTTVGTGTIVSDHLSIMNMETSGTSFRVSRVRIGENNFLGNNIVFPPNARTGDNVLLASNVMVPTDGPIRRNVGLLGSPPFEIPRTVERDTHHDGFDDPTELRRRLAAKNRHNAVTAALFLLVRWVQLGIVVLTAELALDLYGGYGPLTFAAAAVVALVGTSAVGVTAERAAWGFRRLTPELSSIHEPYFWRHERLWKLLAKPMLAGTPFNNILWRLLGVRIGRRVFDDGCSMPEKTLVSIGDDAILNAGSTIQCHSLEDGAFKSGRSVIGAHATLGVQAFVHYDVTVGDEAVLDAAAFLMKGEVLPPLEHWRGNPARPTVAAGPGGDARTATSDRIDEMERMLDRPSHAAAGPGRKRATPALLAGAVVLLLAALLWPAGGPAVPGAAGPASAMVDAGPPAVVDAAPPPESANGPKRSDARRGSATGRPARATTPPGPAAAQPGPRRRRRRARRRPPTVAPAP